MTGLLFKGEGMSFFANSCLLKSFNFLYFLCLKDFEWWWKDFFARVDEITKAVQAVQNKFVLRTENAVGAKTKRSVNLIGSLTLNKHSIHTHTARYVVRLGTVPLSQRWARGAFALGVDAMAVLCSCDKINSTGYIFYLMELFNNWNPNKIHWISL